MLNEEIKEKNKQRKKKILMFNLCLFPFKINFNLHMRIYYKMCNVFRTMPSNVTFVFLLCFTFFGNDMSANFTKKMFSCTIWQKWKWKKTSYFFQCCKGVLSNCFLKLHQFLKLIWYVNCTINSCNHQILRKVNLIKQFLSLSIPKPFR